MSADGKVVIEVELDSSAVGSDLRKLANSIDLNKSNIAECRKELDRLNKEMSTASPAAAKKLQHEIDVQNNFIDGAKNKIAELSAEYRAKLNDMVAAGATTSKRLGMTFANISNPKMATPDLSDLMSSGKVDVDVDSKLSSYYDKLRTEAESAADSVTSSNNTIEASSESAANSQAADVDRINRAIATEEAEQERLAQSILRIQLAYQSGKLTPEGMEDAKTQVAKLAEEFNECSLNINEYSKALLAAGDSGDKSKFEPLADSFNAESAATEILTHKLKDLDTTVLSNSSLQEKLKDSMTQVTSEMKSEEAQTRANAQAEKEAEKEAEQAEEDAKGRITGVLGLLGMINPAFTRLSYALSKFTKIGNVSFKDIEDKIKGFGKSLLALPPQAKVALGAVAGTVASASLSIVAMSKTIKTVMNITKQIGSIAFKAGSAFAKAYDFDKYFGSVDTMMKAYNDFQESETALASLMRSRMGATNDDIKSIRDLVAAEEAEGVVSKQNQTAALKQLAAYTSQTDSIKTLLPVMNDFTVQMYGVNATEDESVSAAKLFGKAMKGQTETLRRSGYVTEEQAEAIKNAGTETERAALLAQFMEQRCANMNQVLASTDSGKQQRLANSMADVQREFGMAASTLKTAFIPIATQVLAVLARMATYAAAAAKSISRLFGGTGKVASAAVGQIEDVTDATETAGKATEAAGKAAKKAASNTLGIDELNVLSQDEDKSSGGAGGGGGAGGVGIDPALVEEDTGLVDDLSSAFDSLLAKIHDSYSAGLVLGTTLKNALANIPWDDIKSGATEAGTAIAQFFNGILDSGVIEQFGTTMGEAINTVTNFWLGIVDTFDFAHFGTTLANSLENMINTIDWGRLGKLFGDSFIGIFKVINNFFESFDWSSVGKAIADFLCGIDWLEVLGQVVEFAINALAAILVDLPVLIISFLIELVSNIVKGIAEYVTDTMKEQGVGLIGALLLGIVDAIKNIVKWVWDHVVSPIIMAFAKYFGVDSNEFKEKGDELIEGFFKGIIDAMASIFRWIKEHIFDPIIDAIKTLFGIHSPSTVFAEIGQFLMEGLLNGIKSLVHFVTDIWNKIKDTAVSIFNKLHDLIHTIWSGISNVIVTVVTGIKNGVQSIFKKAVDIVVGIFNALKTQLHTIWSAISGVVIGVVDGIKNGIKTAFETASNIAVSIFTTMKDAVVGVFDDIKTALKTVINGILGFIGGMVNGVVDGINLVIRAFNKLKVDVPDWVPAIGGKTLGFNIPELKRANIPQLATGAVLPPNNPFLAVVGDQKQGTNVEAPIETIQDAVASVLAPYLERLISITESIDSKDYTTYIGDREIAQANLRGQRQLGVTIRTM